jgi:hypothetical protein
MRQHELEVWLRGSDDQGSTAADIAILGVDTGVVTEPIARSIGFVLAVLRDIYADDAAVWRWLWRPRSELGYARAADLLLAGDGARIEALVTYQWNAAQTGGGQRSVTTARVGTGCEFGVRSADERLRQKRSGVATE